MDKYIQMGMILGGMISMVYLFCTQYDNPYIKFRENCNGEPVVCDCTTSFFREEMPRKEMKTIVRAMERGNLLYYLDSPELIESSVLKTFAKAGVICGKNREFSEK